MELCAKRKSSLGPIFLFEQLEAGSRDAICMMPHVQYILSINVIGLLTPYHYRYWQHASKLLLVIDRNKKSSTLLRLHLIEKKKNKIMAHLTHSIARNNASVLSKIADKNLPVLSNFILHVPLRIILVSSVNAASSKHDCKFLSYMNQ